MRKVATTLEWEFILDKFGWGRGITAVMFSLNLLVYGLLAPVAGSQSDRWKPRWVMPIGIAILGLVTASCAFAQERQREDCTDLRICCSYASKSKEIRRVCHLQEWDTSAP